MVWLRWLFVLCSVLALARVAAAAPPPPETAGDGREAIIRAAEVVRSVAGARRLVLLGELHGTREVPQLVAALADAYGEEGPVLVAVEIDQAEQRAIDAFLRSDGGPRARAALTGRPYWTLPAPRNDGRRNEALVELFEHVRRMRSAGRDIAVLAMDVPGTPDHHARDRGMAAVLRAAYAALPRGRLLVATGNVHAMLERPANAPALMQVPMGAWLRDLDPVSFRITARSGEFRACRKRCGPAPADGTGRRTGAASGPYHHVIVLPRHRTAPLIGAAPLP